MGQNINLYQSVLIDKPEPLQAKQAGLLLLGFFILLISLTLFSYWQLHTQQQTFARLQQQENELTASLSQLEQQFPHREKNALLEEKIRQVERQLGGQKQLLGYFSGKDEAGNGGILGTLEGLAKHVHNGVWLKRIQLYGSGQEVKLVGTALRPEQVPAYLQFLGRQGVFSGQTFSSLKLARLNERPGEVDFSLETIPERQP